MYTGKNENIQYENSVEFYLDVFNNYMQYLIIYAIIYCNVALSYHLFRTKKIPYGCATLCQKQTNVECYLHGHHLFRLCKLYHSEISYKLRVS